MLTFSVIIPMYNAQRYIRDCLDSILNQTYGAYEIIVVDDGSKDSSVDIVNEYKLKNKQSNIRLIQQEHKNAGAARNIGIAHATGDYLIFLDADDKFSEKLLEEIMIAVDNKMKEEIVVWDGTTFDDKTGKIKDVNYILDLSNISKENVLIPRNNSRYLYQFTISVVWNKAFLTSFIRDNNIKFQEILKANDVYFTFVAMAVADRIRLINKKMVFYRYGNKNSLQGAEKGKSIDFYYALVETKRELEERNLYNQFKMSFNNVCLTHCINELNARRNGNDFAFIYRCLKEYMIKKLELQKLSEDSCYIWPYYEMLNKILNKNLESFLYDERTQMVSDCNQLMNENHNLMECNHILMEDNCKKIWPFPFHKILPGTKLVLYGAGDMGTDFEKQIKESQYCRLILWVDINYTKYQKKGMDVNDPYRINEVNFENVLIAIKEEKVRNSVVYFLERMGLNKKQII